MPIIVTDNGPVVVDPRPDARPQRTPFVAPQFGFEWVGTDGQTWDLVRGPVEILSGARGFGYPNPQHWRRESLGHGSMHNGLRFPAREVYMPVEVVSRKAMLDLDRSFNAGFNPYGTGRLRVIDPNAQWREIVCRYDEGLEGEYDTDPLLKGRAVYPIRLTAEDPFWRGAPVVTRVPFVADTGGTTFPGPPFYRPPANKLNGEVEVVNPGDVESYAVWTVSAPFTGFEVGIGDQFVKMTLTKTTGFVRIDTTGGITTFTDETGANVRRFASDFETPPIPPGATMMRLNVSNPNVGSEAALTFEPSYFRAW